MHLLVLRHFLTHKDSLLSFWNIFWSPKDFDTVDLEVLLLLRKLEYFDISEIINNWFVSSISADRVSDFSGTFSEGMFQLTEWTIFTDKS